ncbi:uncharacterized protein cubi_01697 [Cryptosporidium ubiquitum]|uniref:Uncharacterized protein n=1 Tax=Cryptosporidium ubiquitum TaxID=857276 RepID=A0A1J4MAH2_9CRYT|nr:uncharacterized protein cubi_01697 [Cryptosporidium ubiquitum]OII71222.1 hypothetical protein cubi_01697 [Cryptosporidium ubiquitum]
MISNNYSLKYFITVLFIILYAHLNDELQSSKPLISKNIQSIAQISLLKAYANSDKSDSNSVKSFETVSMGSSYKNDLSVSDSSDRSDLQSISSSDSRSEDERFKLLGFARNLVKSKSSPDVSSTHTKSRGIKGRLLNLFKKRKNPGGGFSQENILGGETNQFQNRQIESQLKKGRKDLEDTGEDDNEENDQEVLPPNPNIENIVSADFQGYDAGIMQIYLESQVASSDSQITKSKEILQNNKELYRSIKKSYNEQIKAFKCDEYLLENIFVISNQIYVAKSYCQMAVIKITNETGFCRNRCRILHSKECKTCRKAFNRKDKCKSISNTVDHMIGVLEKMVKGCLINNFTQLERLDAFKLYKNLTPFKCTKNQYQVLKGKLETKLFILSLKVSYVNNVVRQKYVCSSCTREECMSCTSMAYCPQCPGLEDISSCSNCLAAQNLQSSLMLERNQLIKDYRRLYSKLLSCESFLALTGSRDFITADIPTESQVGKYLEERVNSICSRYLPFYSTGHTHHKKSAEPEGLKARQPYYRSLPDDIKNAILNGVKLKTPTHQKVEIPQLPTQLGEAFKKYKKRKEEKYGSQGFEEYIIRSSPVMESTDEERKAAVLLFERGICTYLMINLLNQELRNCNAEIDLKSSQHSGCENCISDGCRKKKCNNFPEIMGLILKRENLAKEVQRCNNLGFISQSELKARIDELKNSGLLPQSTSSEVVTVAQTETNELDFNENADEGEEDDENDEITRL